MYRRTINPLLVFFSVIGGVIGFVTGERLLEWGEASVPNVLLMGMYFGQLALWVGLLCLLAELISPDLNGKSWRVRYAKDGWKLLLPATLVLLFAAGAGLQFLYGLHFGKNQPPQDILMAIDISQSMLETDPSRESIRAAKQLVQELDAQKRTAIVLFNEQAAVIQTLVPVKDQATKDAVKAVLDSIGAPIGGTNIGGALQKTMEQMEAAKGDQRKSMVILISDGYSEVDLNAVLAPYKSGRIIVNTVGMNIPVEEGNNLLKRIASETGGTFHKIDDMQNLADVITQIYKSDQSWYLVGERTGTVAGSWYYATLRVLFLLLIGTLMGLSLGIMFDNRFLAKTFSIGGTAAGLLAGLILEVGIQVSHLMPVTGRAAADVVLAVTLSLATAFISYKQGSSDDQNTGIYSRNRKGAANGVGRRQPNTHRDFQ